MLMFENFLTNSDVYKSVEQFWEDLFKEIVKNDLKDYTVFWMERCSADGTKLLDGNPIFTALNKSRSVSVRIIQENPRDGFEYALDAWQSLVGDEIDELVISCVLTKEVEPLVKKLIFEYLVEKMIGPKMDIVIDEVIRKFESSRS